MLERGKLRIGTASAIGERTIEDADTGERLGSARPAIRPPWWFLARTVLEVREVEDAPLVFTIQRTRLLGSRYDVCDAEGRVVGWLNGPVVVDGDGHWLTALEPDGALRNRLGSLLARVEPTKGGMEIQFSDALALDPFVRMLLLAAALVSG